MNKKQRKMYLRDREMTKNLLLATFGVSACNALANIISVKSNTDNAKRMGFELSKTQSKVNACLAEVNSLSIDFKKHRTAVRKALAGDTTKLNKQQLKTVEKILSSR